MGVRIIYVFPLHGKKSYQYGFNTDVLAYSLTIKFNYDKKQIHLNSKVDLYLVIF